MYIAKFREPIKNLISIYHNHKPSVNMHIQRLNPLLLKRKGR